MSLGLRLYFAVFGILFLGIGLLHIVLWGENDRRFEAVMDWLGVATGLVFMVLSIWGL